MSHQPLPLENQFSGVANISNGEFQGKYVHFNVIPNYGKTDQCIVSKPLVHEIEPHHIMTHEIDLTGPPNEQAHSSLFLRASCYLVGKSMYSRPTLHM